ncbi:ABC transporter permease [Christensenellaceae bacterium OttesenSCG-928-L17]|nr:ABC transporter permease [Christensenellaceae bacterium OttesenSCG-928-L17]
MKITNIFSRKNRILLRELVKTDFKLRYQGSVLGHLWSIIKPLLMFAIMYIVFVHFLRFGADIPHFAIALLLAQVLWSFFVEATGQGMMSIVGRGDLLRKINFPKYIIVISSTIGALINLAINLVVVLVFALINGVDFHWYILLTPLLIIELYVLALGLAFGLSALYIKFRDIGQIWDVVIQGAYFATPIIYPITMIASVSPLAARVLMINPMAQIIQDARYLIVSPENVTTWQMNPFYIAILPIVITILVTILAGIYFRKHSKRFAEEV